MRNHPHLIGRPISDLFKGKIPVFALSRAGDLIWNPEPDLQLRFRDSLICYGDLAELREKFKQNLFSLPSFNEGEKDSAEP
jgi:K+/H+ antiporter YhaU regulatory subunit KhtT